MDEAPEELRLERVEVRAPGHRFANGIVSRGYVLARLASVRRRCFGRGLCIGLGFGRSEQRGVALRGTRCFRRALIVFATTMFGRIPIGSRNDPAGRGTNDRAITHDRLKYGLRFERFGDQKLELDPPVHGTETCRGEHVPQERQALLYQRVGGEWRREKPGRPHAEQRVLTLDINLDADPMHAPAKGAPIRAPSELFELFEVRQQ
jgi:hypothetical protein